MDKWQTIQAFWSGFSIPAYDENSVPDSAVMPYITYQAITSDFEDQNIMPVSVWYRSSSWADISQKVDEISQRIGSHLELPMGDREYIHIQKGSPFAQRMKDEDNTVKRIYINVVVEYFTRN